MAFPRTPADVLLLEVGLGGRLDTTNVVDTQIAAHHPRLDDHMGFLGDTLEKIAFEKAGILRPHIPAVISPQRPTALEVVEGRAAEVGAPLTVWDREYSARFEGETLSLLLGNHRSIFPKPALAGAHQAVNAGTALAVAETVSGTLPTTVEQRGVGLKQVVWPARMQRLQKGPLVDRLPPGWSLWLDGGHNADAGRVIADHLAAWRREADGPIHLVIGMLNSKEPQDYLAPFISLADHVATVSIPGEPNTLTAEDLEAVARSIGLSTTARSSVQDAVTAALSNGSSTGRILIGGSLYLAGTVLAENS